VDTGLVLFQKAELAYASHRSDEAFELYQKAIKKILKDENVVAKLPAIVLHNAPEETLGFLWQNLTGFFKDPAMNYTAETSPEAFKLLNKFRPGHADKSHERFRTPQAKIFLKGLQIVAGMTLGLLAWDKQDRPTAAKRYRETLDLAKTHAPFDSLGDNYGEAPKPGHQNMRHFELYVATTVKETKNNLALIILNDTINAGEERSDVGGLRKEIVPAYTTRIEPDGSTTILDNHVMATDRCAHCGKRDVKLMRCSRCLKVAYCDAACQTADWRTHKVTICTPKKK